MTAVSPGAFIEFAVVAAFAAAWIILELVCKRLDRKRDEAARKAEDGQSKAPIQDSGDAAH
jgi:ABC-type uncharacterized transport system YnjBCD permease subunit